MYDVRDAKDPPKLQVVKWRDHSTYSTWASYDTHIDAKVPSVYSVGWVIFEDKEQVILSHSGTKSESCCLSTSVLKNCIEARWDLNDKSTPKEKK